MTPKAQATKAKLTETLNQTKKLLYWKGKNKKSENTTCRMGENVCKPYIWKGAIILNIQGSCTTE